MPTGLYLLVWADRADGYGLAVSGFNDQLSDLYRIVKLSWPILHYLPFPLDSGQIGLPAGWPADTRRRLPPAGRPDRVFADRVAESPSVRASVWWSA